MLRPVDFAQSLAGVRPWWIITVAYLLVAFTAWGWFGVKEVADTERYLEYADGLRNGIYIDLFNIWYVGYVLFLFVMRLVTTDPLWVVVVQYVISFVAAITLYNTSLILFNDKARALLAALLYVFFFEVISWNSYLLPEGIYMSFIVFSLYAITRTRRSIMGWVVGTVIVLFTILIKPTGIAIAGALIAMFFANRPCTRARMALMTLSLILLVLAANLMLNSYVIIDNYLKGEIVYGMTTLPGHPDYELLTVELPANVSVPEPGIPLQQIGAFIVTNPWFFSKLFFSKIFFLIVHLKPYWSVTHATFIGLILFPSYFFFFRGLHSARLDKAPRAFFATYILLHILIIGMTSEDWDGRFLMPLLPVIFLLAPIGYDPRSVAANGGVE